MICKLLKPIELSYTGKNKHENKDKEKLRTSTYHACINANRLTRPLVVQPKRNNYATIDNVMIAVVHK